MQSTSRFVFLIVVFTSFVVFLTPGRARTDSTALHLVAQGNALLAENKLNEAEQNFRRALQRERDLIAAMAGLGQVAIAREDWGEANDWYEKILQREPENIDAMYHRGICYRETGKFKVLLLRKLDWDKSADHFERVLAQDSLYRDTIFQYAQLQRYREKYTEAILLAHRQVRLKPELVESQCGLFRLYHYFLDHENENQAISWLQQHDSEQARYFIGEKLRRTGKLAAADSTLREWLVAARSVSPVPVYLSLTRLHYQLQQPQAAEKFFWQAVEEIRNPLDAALVFEDVKYIVTDAELQAFRRLSSPQECVAFFHQLWASRDPTPAANLNARLVEHYRRLLYAEQNYLYDGFRTWFNSPDKFKYLKYPPAFYLNDRFNDKGLIYIRHGEPSERAVTVAPDIAANESWRYGQTEISPEMIFHFVIDDNATGNNWRLTPFVNHPEFVEDRVSWGSTYHRLLRRDPLDRLRLEDEMAQQSRDAVSVGFRTDRHTWDKNVQPLKIYSYTASFKGPEGKDYFEVYYGVAMPKIDDSSHLGKTDTTVLYENGLALHDFDWNLIERRQGEITKEMIAGLTKQELLIGQYRFTVKPDSYHVAFFMRQPATQNLGGWKEKIHLPQFSENDLAISSIVLAASITPAADDGLFVKNRLRVIPNPSRSFARSQPVYVYFEVYNLTPDAQGKFSFIAEYTVSLIKKKSTGVKKLFSAFRSDVKPATTLVVERQADDTTSVEYLALDLSRSGAGEFRLNVKVTDRYSKNQSEGFIGLMLF
jgi:hypothetical protein